MLGPFPFDAVCEIGDLVMIGHSIEFMGLSINAGEVGIVTLVYDTSWDSRNIYDCIVVLKCGYALDCWFGELINLTSLDSNE